MKPLNVQTIGPSTLQRVGGRLPRLDRSDAAALSCFVSLASRLIHWNELAEAIDPFLPKTGGENWYAPRTTATMLRSYFLRRWFDLSPQDLSCLIQGDIAAAEEDIRFDYFFEHYQLKEAVQPQIERELLGTGLFSVD
jgi:hypothetical protein